MIPGFIQINFQGYANTFIVRHTLLNLIFYKKKKNMGGLICFLLYVKYATLMLPVTVKKLCMCSELICAMEN